ncbi:hypothetical protein [Bradyrhizobium sp. STM 3566]|uniref:hypothetical protein n=1 Tax=Bradyrhizobium sp. STM 3566 TaxID=578928 RepID=UPI003890D61C
MTRTGAFFLGALGGLLPILVSLLTLDLAPIIDHHETLTLGNYIGYGIRVCVLLTLGGTVAVLNNEVRQPFSLVQLGIAAPALVTSFINAAPAAARPQQQAFFSIISSAYASDAEPKNFRVAGGFLGEVLEGIQPGFGRNGIQQNQMNSVAPQVQQSAPSMQAPNYSQPYGAPTPGSLGNYCQTQAGIFGPGPVSPIGTYCTANTVYGVLPGQVVNPAGGPVQYLPPSAPSATSSIPSQPVPAPTATPNVGTTKD